MAWTRNNLYSYSKNCFFYNLQLPLMEPQASEEQHEQHEQLQEQPTQPIPTTQHQQQQLQQQQQQQQQQDQPAEDRTSASTADGEDHSMTSLSRRSSSKAYSTGPGRKVAVVKSSSDLQAMTGERYACTVSFLQTASNLRCSNFGPSEPHWHYP